MGNHRWRVQGKLVTRLECGVVARGCDHNENQVKGIKMIGAEAGVECTLVYSYRRWEEKIINGLHDATNTPSLSLTTVMAILELGKKSKWLTWVYGLLEKYRTISGTQTELVKAIATR